MDAARPLREVFRELASGTSEHSRELASGTSEHSRELASGTSEHSRERASGTSEHSRELASGTSEHSRERASDGGPAPEPSEVLRVNGHADLPDGLVAEAVTSYADTAAIEVAEHLAPYVMSNSAVPVANPGDVDPAGWLDVLTTVPPGAWDATDAALDEVDNADAVFANQAVSAPSHDLDVDLDFGGHGAFGTGGGAHDPADADPDLPVHDVADDLHTLPPLHHHEPASAEPVLDAGGEPGPEPEPDDGFDP